MTNTKRRLNTFFQTSAQRLLPKSISCVVFVCVFLREEESLSSIYSSNQLLLCLYGNTKETFSFKRSSVSLQPIEEMQRCQLIMFTFLPCRLTSGKLHAYNNWERSMGNCSPYRYLIHLDMCVRHGKPLSATHNRSLFTWLTSICMIRRCWRSKMFSWYSIYCQRNPCIWKERSTF